ncbi:30S ribosomal protein S10, partial [Candidatus Woesebacteria bacterium CG22_combo_CG10-13_8_21_14_all_39_10]
TDKNAQEHYEILVHKRLIDILDPSSRTIDSLSNLDLPAGVSIEIKM